MTARIAPLAPPYPAEIAAHLDRFMPPGMPPLAIFRTAARNPRVLAKMGLGNLLDRGSIDRADRELVILRACALCGAEYEWGVHVAGFALKVGFTPAQVAATDQRDIDPALWSPRQQLLLQMVDSLHARYRLDDALWTALAAEFSEEQLIELLMLAGQYHQISMLVNGLQLAPEPMAPRFPANRTGEEIVASMPGRNE